MKRKKTALLTGIALTLLLTLALSGCSSETGGDIPQPSAEASTAPEPQKTAPLPEEPALMLCRDQSDAATASDVSVDFASDALLAKAGSFDEYIELGCEKSEYLVKLAFTAAKELNEFQVFSVSYSGWATGKNSYAVDGVICEAIAFSPDRPIVVGTEFPGDTSYIGFSYLDEDETVRYFIVGESGLDGSLFLNEYSVE